MFFQPLIYALGNPGIGPARSRTRENVEILHVSFLDELWRRGWDSNPRSSYPDSSFRDCPIRPLSHLSALSMLGWLAYRQIEASGVKERAELTLASGVLQWLHTPLLTSMHRIKNNFELPSC